MSVPSGPRTTKRHVPPTFRSTSQTTSDQPRGPNQRLSSSGLVKASKTWRRGASKTRVSTTSRSVGVVTFNVPVFFIGDHLHRFVRSLFFMSLLPLGHDPSVTQAKGCEIISGEVTAQNT